MAKRLREIFEASDVSPPTSADWAGPNGFMPWVMANIQGDDRMDACACLVQLPPAKRARLVGCGSRDEFLNQVYADHPGSPRADITHLADDFAAAAAFLEYPLENPDILDELWRKLESDYTEWIKPDRKYVAPYFAVVQSSGWGKSRMVSELHNKGLYIVYVSCMKSSAKGFPGETPVLANWICDKGATPEWIAAFLIASMRVLRSHVSSNKVGPALWMKMQTDPKLQFPLSKQIYEASMLARQELDAAIQAKRAEGGMKLLDSQITYAVLTRAFGDVLAQLPFDGFFGGLKVLFCFDEATTLIETRLQGLRDTSFALLRRVLGTIRSGVWGVVLGTDSRLSNFASPQHLDTTSKATILGYELFKPFWLTGASASPQPKGHPFRIGRPLWRALLDGGRYTPADLAGLATKKLNVELNKLTDEMVVGVLGCSIGVEVASWSEVAERSMTYHMMTAGWISSDRKLVHVSNAAEPVLAAAAASFLLDDKFLLPALVRVCRMCKEGIVMPGRRGELVTRLLVLLPILLCLSDKRDVLFMGKVTLREFLTKLLGKVPDGLHPSVDLSAELQMNSFSPTYRDLTQELLKECYNLHRGLTCKPGQEAVDYVLRTDKGDVGIQSKRWEQDNNTRMMEAVNKLEGVVKEKVTKRGRKLTEVQTQGTERGVRKLEIGTGGGVKFLLGLAFQLGSTSGDVRVKGSKKRTIVVHGFSNELFPFLSRGVAEVLHEILKLRTPTHVSQMTPKEQDIVKRVFPLSYSF